MDPVATAHSVLKIIWEINNTVKEVEENREQCEYLAGRLSSFELILHNEKLRSHAQFGSLVSSLKIFIEEAKDFVVGFLPKKSAKKTRGIKKQVKNQVRRVADFLSSFANRKDHAKRFLELDTRLTKWRDDINAVTGIVTRVDLDHSTMMDQISLNMKNELVREINKVRDEVCRGATLPSDIEAFRGAPDVVQAVVNELSTVAKVTNSTAISLSSPQLQHFVAKTVEDMILISRTQRVPMMETVFPSDVEDIHERFQLQDRLGMPGSYGVTFRATYTPDGRVYAVKRVDVGRARHMGCSSDLIEREAYSLKKLTHRHIVRFYHSFFDEPEEFYYLVMELVLGMTLGHYVTSRPRPELLLKWLQQLTSALVYMHGDCRMVHRDLKPANIMITQDMEDVKLIDFGLARVMADSGHTDSTAGRMTAAAGTTLYMSYEKLEGLPYDGRDDVWAVGCIFVELILQQELKCVLAKDDAERAVKMQAMMMQNPGLGQVVASILEGRRQEQRPSSMELLVLLGDVYLSRSPLSPFGGTGDTVTTVEAIDAVPAVHSPRGGVASAVGVSVTSAYSPAATSANTSSTTRNGGLKQEEPLVSLTTLSSEEAVRLLVSIGCATDLRQRVDAMMMEMLDGSFLMEIDDFEIFYELEQTPKTLIRTTHYRKVLKKLQALQRAGGVSRAELQALRDQTKPMLSIIDADQSNESMAVSPTSSLLTHGSHPVAASETVPVLPQIPIAVVNEANDKIMAAPPTPPSDLSPSTVVETLSVPSLSSSSAVHGGGVEGDEPTPDMMQDQMTTTATPARNARGITEPERNEMLQYIAALKLQEHPKESIRRLLLNDPTLTTLDLSGVYIGDAKEFAIALRVNTTLTALNLSGYILGATEATELASALRENTTLTTLDVSHNVIGPTGTAELASTLRENTTLRTLNLSYNVIGAAGAKEVAVVLRENPTLTTLILSNNVIGVGGAKAMASALRVNSTLTTLDLGGNVIGTEGAAVMASALQVNTTLTTLDLRGNVIRATGATEVVSALRENTALTMLDLRDNCIEAAGAMEIVFALRGNTTLMTLDLRDNGIEAAPDVLRDIAIVNNNVRIVL